jgi:hypothetical protein
MPIIPTAVLPGVTWFVEKPIPISQKWDTCDNKTVDESRRFFALSLAGANDL